MSSTRSIAGSDMWINGAARPGARLDSSVADYARFTRR